MTYADFLASKQRRWAGTGFTVAPDALPAALFDWQRQCVCWALRQGCAALWHDTGLGKTIQQLAWAEQVAIGIELKESYARTAAENLRLGETLQEQGTLFHTQEA